jgi:hypothetical protein
MELLGLPIHDESVKTNYYTWWQNVRESYKHDLYDLPNKV